MKISMIVACGLNYQIGKDNSLLWHIPEDFKNFKKLTTGHHLLMGRKTFESIGKPLPNRTSVVLSENGFSFDGVSVFKEVQEALDFCKQNGEDEVFIIGGAQVYKLMLPYVNRMYLSQVNYDGDADAFLDKIDFSMWNVEEEQVFKEIQEENKHIPAWTFKILNKI
jgi:dihydrofolate reductase